MVAIPKERFTLGKKFFSYPSIDSFEEYLLVAQDKPYVTHYVRQTDGSWLRTDIEGIESEIDLVTIPCKITLSEIYAFVRFSVAGE